MSGRAREILSAKTARNAKPFCNQLIPACTSQVLDFRTAEALAETYVASKLAG